MPCGWKTLSEIIANYFCRPSRKDQFTWLLLRREAMTFQNKIDIVRNMVPEFKNTAAAAAAQELKPLLKRVENFKEKRNAFALDMMLPRSQLRTIRALTSKL